MRFSLNCHRIGLILALALACFAQQGHPLTGTWSGDWGASAAQRHQITLVLNWDGKNVTGLINPGPDAIPIKSVAVDVSTWTIRIQAEGISAEGKLEDLGSYHRTITGTWQQGAAKGDFKIARD